MLVGNKSLVEELDGLKSVGNLGFIASEEDARALVEELSANSFDDNSSFLVFAKRGVVGAYKLALVNVDSVMFLDEIGFDSIVSALDEYGDTTSAQFYDEAINAIFNSEMSRGDVQKIVKCLENPETSLVKAMIRSLDSQSMIKSLTTALEAVAFESEVDDSEVAELRDKLAKALEYIETADNENAKLTNQLAELESERAKLIAELEEVKSSTEETTESADIKGMEEAIELLSQAVKERDNKIEELKAQIESLSGDDKSAMVNELEERVAELKGLIDSKELEVKELREEIDGLKLKIAENTATISSLIEEIEKAENTGNDEEAQKLNEEVRVATEKLQASVEQFEKLQIEYNEVIASLNKERENSVSLGEKITILENEKAELESELNSKAERLAELESQVENNARDISKEAESLGLEVAQLNKELDKKNDTIDALKLEVEKAKSEAVKASGNDETAEAIEFIKEVLTSVEKNGLVAQDLKNRAFSLTEGLKLMVDKLKGLAIPSTMSSTQVNEAYARSCELKIEEYEKNYSLISRENAKLKSDIENYIITRTRYENEIVLLRDKIKALSSEGSKFVTSTEYHTVKDLADKYRVQIAELKDYSKKLEAEKVDLLERLNEANEENDKLSENIKELSIEGKVTDNVAEDFQHQIAELKEKLLMIDVEKEELESVNEKLVEEKALLEKDKEELAKQLLEARADKPALGETTSSFEESGNDNNEVLVKEIDALKKENEELTERVGMNDELASKCETLEAELQEKIAELEEATVKNNQYATKIEEVIAELKGARDELNETKSELDRVKAEVESTIQSLDTAEVNSDDSEKDQVIAELTEKLNALTAERDSLLAKLEETTAEYESLRARAEELERPLDEVAGAIDIELTSEEKKSLEARIAELHEMLDQSDAEKARVQEELDDVKNNNIDLAEEINNLQIQLNEIQEKGSELVKVASNDVTKLFPVLTNSNSIDFDKMYYIKEIGSSNFTDDLISYLPPVVAKALQGSGNTATIVVLDPLHDEDRLNLYKLKKLSINEKARREKPADCVVVTDSLSFDEIKEMAELDRSNIIFFIDRHHKAKDFVKREDVTKLNLVGDRQYLSMNDIDISTVIAPFPASEAKCSIKLPEDYASISIRERISFLIQSKYLVEVIRELSQLD